MLVKSIYIMAYVMASNAISIWSAWRLYVHGADIAWAGVLLAWLPGALFFNYITLTKSLPRTSANLPLVTGLIGAGAVLAAFGLLRNSQGGLQALLIAVAGLLAWLLYLFWYSRYGQRDNSVLRPGRPMPEFSLQNEQGEAVHFSRFLGRPAVFVFYRGNWCPLCMAQIREIAAGYRALSERGVQVVLVSPQPHAHTRRLAKQFDVPFTYLVDEGNELARRLKILAPKGLPFGMQLLGYDSDTVMPTVVVTDEEGTIVFADLTDNYRVRPEPGTFLEALSRSTPA